MSTARDAFVDWATETYHLSHATGAYLRQEWLRYRTGRESLYWRSSSIGILGGKRITPTAIPLWWSQLSHHERLQFRRIPGRLRKLK
jgi:hypothetical protein